MKSTASVNHINSSTSDNVVPKPSRRSNSADRSSRIDSKGKSNIEETTTPEMRQQLEGMRRQVTPHYAAPIVRQSVTVTDEQSVRSGISQADSLQGI